MTITAEQHTELERLIEAYVQAAIADSWKGGGDPADIPAIELDLIVAKIDLAEYMRKL